MDSPNSCEKSLPGMSMPRWMKRATERYDYTDICSTPPSDGILHLNPRHRPSGFNNSAVECVLNQRRRVTSPAESAPNLGSALADIDKRTSLDCSTSDASSFFNSVTKSSIINLASTQAALTILPGNVLNMNTHGADETGMSLSSYQSSVDKRQDKNDTALTPLETPSLILPNCDEGGSKRLVEKLSGNWSVPCTPDVTPSSTPAVTPTCSPKVSRRSGNPFFTGGPASNSSGSWLFRPAQSPEQDGNRRNILYEAKVDIKQQPNSQSSKKTVRYVPRPSELRELNFWSPTSM